MKSVWDELIREVGGVVLFTAAFSVWFLVCALIGLLYVCS